METVIEGQNVILGMSNASCHWQHWFSPAITFFSVTIASLILDKVHKKKVVSSILIAWKKEEFSGRCLNVSPANLQSVGHRPLFPAKHSLEQMFLRTLNTDQLEYIQFQQRGQNKWEESYFHVISWFASSKKLSALLDDIDWRTLSEVWGCIKKGSGPRATLQMTSKHDKMLIQL